MISSLLPNIPAWIVLITIARDAWHSEQRTNASKQVLILYDWLALPPRMGYSQSLGMLR